MQIMLTLDNIVDLVCGVVLVVVGVAVFLPQWWRQHRCLHKQGVNETRACDAICKGCGKNLGFIGKWRRRQEGGD